MASKTVVPSRASAGGTPFKKGHAKTGGRTKGTPNKVTTEHKEFLESVLESEEYRTAAKERMVQGRAPHLEQLGWHYKRGKPKETVELGASPSLAKFLLLVMSPDEPGDKGSE